MPGGRGGFPRFGARRRRRVPGVIFWRNLRPADLATLLAAIATNTRKPAGGPAPADRHSVMADRPLAPRKRPLASGGGAGD
jgi:hypothetical protein